MRTVRHSLRRAAEIFGGPVGLRRQGLSAALLVGVVCLAAAGCGETPTGVPPAPPTAPDGEGQASATPPALPPLPTLAAVPGTRVHRATWRVLAEQDPAADQVVVEVDVGGPPCDVVTGLEVNETNETVVLTVWAGAEEGREQDCDTAPLTLGTHALVVPLGGPLAERVVIESQ